MPLGASTRKSASRAIWIATSIAVALVGCGLASVGTGQLASEQDAAGSDATVSDARTGDGGGSGLVDGGSSGDAGVPLEGGCFVLVSDDFSNPDPRWVVMNDGTFAGGAAVLVQPQILHRGGIFMAVDAAIPPSTLHATFTMLMAADAGPADAAPGDGIMLAWASDLSTPPLGGTGSEMGFCPDSNSASRGPNGAALALHVSPYIGASQRESDGGYCVVNNNPVPVAFTGSQKVAVSVTGVYIDGGVGSTAFNFELSKAVPIRWIGFTAGTGGDVATFSVDNVVITICP